ncbi:MAG: bifunctional nuclease family protein [Kineosporiaceae bacterium]|nr:bifunctional nuclease family protein [Kineosporiaceae bacterium]MBK7624774.1 bifunctional nuclease family protein [Kineosporiaceae bacterium]MBK8076849.1 bifunctional nuclease family protein [Kineosporiaceae bacterium]
MRELDVVGVRVEMPSNSPIVLLRERGGDRYLPIWVAAAEASAIAFAQNGVIPPRPLTHDLLKDVIGALGRRLEEVRIVAIKDNVFHAQLVFDGGLTVDSRSSDAIALALRTGSRIMGADQVLEEGGVAVPDEDEDEVEKFREFLDQISPEDFGESSPGAPGTPGPSES